MKKCKGYYYEGKKKVEFEFGKFLEWGLESKLYRGQVHVNTVAIIQEENGRVITVRPNQMEFYA